MDEGPSKAADPVAMNIKQRAPRNRTITLSVAEAQEYHSRLLRLAQPASPDDVLGRTVCQDLFEAIPHLPDGFVDLMIVDPPYNLDKSFNQSEFKSLPAHEYTAWIERWMLAIHKVLRDDASVYICSDWRSSRAVQTAAEKCFVVRNRITWEREKGRGSLTNWKNCSEDIWFCTVGKQYTFNVDAVKLKRKVVAPYTDKHGDPKDWERTANGGFRLTHPSNLWTDLSVPFWSMPENTDHPTQKPEKLIAKLVLASSNPGDVVFDPFLGSGTTSVVAKKLGRRFCGIEVDQEYCCLAEKRLLLADENSAIQGCSDGVFWERNTLGAQTKSRASRKQELPQPRSLFSDEESA